LPDTEQAIEFPLEDQGAVFLSLCNSNRFDYRIRGHLQIDFLSQKLLNYRYRYDFNLPREFFAEAIEQSNAQDQERERLLAHLDNGGKFRVPVFIMDVMEPAGHAEVTGDSSLNIQVLNRFQTAEIWGILAAGDLVGEARTAVRALEEHRPMLGLPANQAAGRLRRTLESQERMTSVIEVLQCMAWMNGKPTRERVEIHTVPGCCQIVTGQRPGKRDGLFFDEIPTPVCTLETAAFKAMSWAVSEACINERTSEGRGVETFESIKKLIMIARELQELTSRHRRELRDVDRECKYDVVFAATCPVVSPLDCVRAFAKRNYLLPNEAHSPAPLEIVEEYVDSCIVYLETIRDLVLLLVASARAAHAAEADRVRLLWSHRAARLLKLFDNLRSMSVAWKVIALIDVIPGTGFSAEAEMLLPALPTSVWFQKREQVRRIVQQQIISLGANTGLLAERTKWNRRLRWTKMRLILLRTIPTYVTRGIWQHLIKLHPQNWRFFTKRQEGFLTTTIWTKSKRSRRYLSVPLSSHDSPHFFSDDTQTHHVVINLQGSELEIRPETTFIKVPQSVLNISALKEEERQEKAAKRIQNMRDRQAQAGKRWNACLESRIQRSRIADLRRRSWYRETRKSRRLAPDEVYGMVYKSDDNSFLRMYSTKDEDQLVRQVEGIQADWTWGNLGKMNRVPQWRLNKEEKKRATPYNFRRAARTGRRPVLIKPVWYRDWHLLIGLRLRREIRTAFLAIIAIFLLMLLATVFVPKSPSSVEYLITFGSPAIMIAVVTFFLSSEHTHVFTSYASRYYRLMVYTIIFAEVGFSVVRLINHGHK